MPGKFGANTSLKDAMAKLAEIFRARIVDVAADSLIVEITGTEDKIDGFLETLRPYGVLEMGRTGRLSMTRSWSMIIITCPFQTIRSSGWTWAMISSTVWPAR